MTPPYIILFVEKMFALEVIVRFKNDYFRTNCVGQRKTYHI